MNIKDEHTSRLWTFIMKGEIMDLDDDELIATRINNKAASWKEVEEYIEKYYVRKDKIKEEIEELQQEIKDEGVDYDWNKNSIISVLQELLQEGDK